MCVCAPAWMHVCKEKTVGSWWASVWKWHAFIVRPENRNLLHILHCVLQTPLLLIQKFWPFVLFLSHAKAHLHYSSIGSLFIRQDLGIWILWLSSPFLLPLPFSISSTYPFPAPLCLSIPSPSLFIYPERFKSGPIFLSGRFPKDIPCRQQIKKWFLDAFIFFF